MPAQGYRHDVGHRIAESGAFRPKCRLPRCDVAEEPAMNVQHKPANLVPESVTIGALPGSRKVYCTPDGTSDVRVPFREIALDPSANEPPVRVYDPSGPYTE